MSGWSLTITRRKSYTEQKMGQQMVEGVSAALELYQPEQQGGRECVSHRSIHIAGRLSAVSIATSRTCRQSAGALRTTASFTTGAQQIGSHLAAPSVTIVMLCFVWIAMRHSTPSGICKKKRLSSKKK